LEISRGFAERKDFLPQSPLEVGAVVAQSPCCPPGPRAQIEADLGLTALVPGLPLALNLGSSTDSVKALAGPSVR